MGRVDGKVAIVTGGASGIGRASARRLAEQGARVVIADRTVDAGEAVAAEIGDGASFIALDVTDEAAWKELIGATTAKHDGLHILVNAAGIYARGRDQNPENISLEDWRRIHAVNMEGVVLGCKHAIPAIRDAGGGSIVNISSLAAMIGTARTTPYGASKAGVRQFTKSVAHYCAKKGYRIRCNSVHPGIIDTPMGNAAMSGVGANPEEGRERYRALVPLGELGEPDDIAYAVLYLASDEAKFVTGAEFVIDGGMSIA